MYQHEKLGQIVRVYRQAKGMSLRQQAFNIGLSPTCLSKIERGEAISVGEELIVKLANAIGADSDYLLSLQGRVPADVVSILLSDTSKWYKLIRG